MALSAYRYAGERPAHAGAPPTAGELAAVTFTILTWIGCGVVGWSVGSEFEIVFNSGLTIPGEAITTPSTIALAHIILRLFINNRIAYRD